MIYPKRHESAPVYAVRWMFFKLMNNPYTWSVLFALLLISPLAIPESSQVEREDSRIYLSGAPCTTRTDIQELGNGSPYQCMVAAYGLDETVKFGPNWHWKNVPDTNIGGW